MNLHTYTEINYKDAPDHKTTPLNASNLNHMDKGIANAYVDIAAVAGEVEAINAKIDKGSVSVTSDGVKKKGVLLAELAALVDYSKLTFNSVLTISGASVIYVYHMDYRSPVSDDVRFTFGNANATGYSALSVRLIKNGSCAYYGGTIPNSGTGTMSDQTNNVEAAGYTYTIRY